MTLSPSEDRRTEGADGPKYELNKVCPVPGCGTGSGLQRHHMWRKSDMIGDFWWVHTRDGKFHGNCVNICRYHHQEITDNIARIVYQEGVFLWKDILNMPIELLWQPPEGQPVNRNPDSKPLEKKEEPVHIHNAEDVCPTCLRKLPRPKDESEEREQKKVRKTWSVAVPLDQWEDGANTIDELLADAHRTLNRNGLPYGEGKTVKFYILTTALGLFVAHGNELMSDE